MLKRKAEQGVKVVLMVWNEKLSTDRTDGVMATHDNDTENFFEGTEVRVQLVTRQKEGGLVEDQFVSFCYSHHQKGEKEREISSARSIARRLDSPFPSDKCALLQCIPLVRSTDVRSSPGMGKFLK